MNSKTVKCTIERHDLFTYRLKNDNETILMYGEDYLDEYGLEVPIELVEEYKAIMAQYKALEDKLRVLYQSKG